MQKFNFLPWPALFQSIFLPIFSPFLSLPTAAKYNSSMGAGGPRLLAGSAGCWLLLEPLGEWGVVLQEGNAPGPIDRRPKILFWLTFSERPIIMTWLLLLANVLRIDFCGC